MMQVIRRYDIYIPLEYNPEPDGTRRRIEGEKFDRVEQKLFEGFGGVTFVQESFPLKGMEGWDANLSAFVHKVSGISITKLKGGESHDL